MSVKKIMEYFDVQKEALPKAFLILEMMLGFDCLARGFDYQYESNVILNWHASQAMMPRSVWGVILIIVGISIFVGMWIHKPLITATAHFTAFIIYLLLAIFVIHQGLGHDIHRLRTLFDMFCVSLANLMFYIIKIMVLKQQRVDKNLKREYDSQLIDSVIQQTSS